MHPWTERKDYSREPEVITWLTQEIRDFVSYMSPSEEDVTSRAETVTRINKVVRSLWPDASVCVFGSYATNLYLPDADIDLAILSPDRSHATRQSLYQLANALKQARVPSEIQVIAKARVPIIKFTDKISGYQVDVSFEQSGGVVAASTIAGWVDTTPGLRELVFIVKAFLARRGLNSVPNGGLGGFAVICLVLSFLQLHPLLSSEVITASDNLGVLLIQFFELYGKNFNYDSVAIDVGASSYHPKAVLLSTIGNSAAPSTYSLVVRDPNDPDNNISRGTYNLKNIRRAFAGAFDILTTQCYEMDAISRRRWRNNSLLSSILS
ncbi:hypothetical protein V1511DRAFT_461037 [Dipodascopsis uninucleata]